jgi:CheY-like chemotaxis protein
VESKHLLCIDDHKDQLGLLRDLLETFGYSVVTASGGNQGLKVLGRSRVDAVILDYEMPGMDGTEVARAVKASRPELPVLMFSGYASELDSGALQHVDCFVPKGQMTEVLLLEIAKLVSSKSASPSCSASSLAGTMAATVPPKKAAGVKPTQRGTGKCRA